MLSLRFLKSYIAIFLRIIEEVWVLQPSGFLFNGGSYSLHEAKKTISGTQAKEAGEFLDYIGFVVNTVVLSGEIIGARRTFCIKPL